MEIDHDIRQQKFYTVINNIEYSLEYNELGARLWEFHCPNFPEKTKKMEIMDKLIEYALYYVKRNKIQLHETSSCMVVQQYLEKKRELQFLVKAD